MFKSIFARYLTLYLRGLTCFVAVMAWVLIAPVVAQAAAAPDAPPLPAVFYGAATLDDANVAPGTLVSAWIGGVKYAETPVLFVDGHSVYRIDVPGDDPDTPGGVEGGQEGEIGRASCRERV